MKRVVISGIGAVLPSGVGSTKNELFSKNNINPNQEDLSSGKFLNYYKIDGLEKHQFYPDRKQCRYMRMDAIYSYVATQIAIHDAMIESDDHTNTSYYSSSGQCYGDMWPSIKTGIDASITNNSFDIKKFGHEGIARVNPFFSLRTLAALPMALISEKYQIHGENLVYESMGAESAEALRQGMSDIQSGRAHTVIVAAQDHLEYINEIDNLYFNNYYSGDFFGSSSASVVVLEEYKHNKKRKGKRYAELLSSISSYYPVKENNEIKFSENCFQNIISQDPFKTNDTIYLSASGTNDLFEIEQNSLKKTFPESRIISNFKKHGTLLAGAEPFGIISLIHENCNRGLSLSRSVFGMESAVFLSREDANA